MKLFYNILLALTLVFAATNAEAVRVENGMHKKCTLNDSWKGPDKTKHIIAGAAVGSAGALIFKEPEYGVLATVFVAGLKEAYDRRGYGTCSFQDFAVTVAAGAAAAYATSWIIVPAKEGAFVIYNKSF